VNDAVLKRLIEPEDLLPRLAERDILVVHVAAPAGYAACHVPGAVLVTPAELVAGTPPATGDLPTAERLAALFSRIGYTPDTEIVAYDDEGGGWAGRLLWTLDVIGHPRWAYLDGGIHAWRAAGAPVETTASARPATPVRIAPSERAIVRADEILRRLDDPELLIWDCRSAEEFRGQRSAAARAGHMPGAVHLDWLDLMDRERALRLRTDLPALLAAHGIDRNRDVVVHCQTHHRSGLAYLVGRLLDFPRIRAYPGSWAEWGNRTDTPVVTGT
jgi:thiosulfate/3-mercaptopyruvate sulfurtransferase